MPIFDTHAHYDSSAFHADREAVLAALPEAGVALVVDPGCDLPTSRAALALAEQFPHVYAAVGIHPEDCAGYTDADLDALRQLCRHDKAVAIGEIGLDYYWAENPPREFQQQVFRRLVERNARNMNFMDFQVIFSSEEEMEAAVRKEAAKWDAS